MAPFRAKIPLKRIRKRENKNFRFVPFLSGAEQKMPKKKSKKIKKIRKYHYGIISSQNSLENAKKERKIKIIVSFRSHPAQNRKCQKKKQKN